MVNVTVSVQGDTGVQARFKLVSDNVFSFVRNAINVLRLKDEALVKSKLTNDVLNVRTGALRRSIFSTISDDGKTITGTIGSSGDVKYAAIHEFGGTINHPGGTAYMIIDGQASFVSNATAAQAGSHIAGRTRPHMITMPERSFLRSAFAEMQPEIRSTIEAAVAKANRS